MNSKPNARIFTVGHGNASFHEIESILRRHGVAMLIDVRSTPYSKYAPDFQKSTLADSATASGLGYRWMGDRLRGHPSRSNKGNLVDPAGAPPVVDSPTVRGALAEVLALNATGPVALLCSERDPEHCHRRLILAPQLENLGLEVFHILQNGSALRHQPSLGI